VCKAGAIVAAYGLVNAVTFVAPVAYLEIQDVALGIHK